jgi:hypothetical protein
MATRLPPAPTLVSISHMARAARVPVAWLRAEAEAGRVPCLRAGRSLLFHLDAVTEALAERAATERLQPAEVAHA